MIDDVATATLLGGGVYILLLGMGHASWPKRLRGHDDVAVVGRILMFLGVLLLPTCFGFSLADIRGWLQDIWSSGGGVGTG
jgi:hypothetical protein